MVIRLGKQVKTKTCLNYTGGSYLRHVEVKLPQGKIFKGR